MAFVPGLSKSQVRKVISDYASIAPATMQLINQLSAQINDPLNPAAVLIGQMATIQNNFNSLSSDVLALESGGVAIIDNTITTSKIVDGAVVNDKIQNGTISNNKLQNSAITINGSSVNLGESISISTGGGGGDSLPSQTGNAGKFLSTNGSNILWETVGVSNSPSSSNSKNPSFRIFELTELASFFVYGMSPNNDVTISKMGGSLSGQIRQEGYYDSPRLENFVSIMNSSYMYQKVLKIPKTWITKQQQDMGSPEEWVYVNFSMISTLQSYDQFKGEYYTSGYIIYFNSYDFDLYNTVDSYSISDFTYVGGQVTGSYLLGERTIDSELAYLDGVSSNIQTQINSIKTKGTVEDLTINVVDYDQVIGNPANSYGWDGSSQGFYSVILTTNPNSESYVDFIPNPYNTLDDWITDIASQIDVTMNTYHLIATGYNFDTELNAKIISINNGKVVLDTYDRDHYRPYWYGTGLSNFRVAIKRETAISPSEIKALDGMTSSIQGQLDAMADVVDAVPATIQSSLVSIFDEPTITKPTLLSEALGGEAYFSQSSLSSAGISWHNTMLSIDNNHWGWVDYWQPFFAYFGVTSPGDSAIGKTVTVERVIPSYGKFISGEQQVDIFCFANGSFSIIWDVIFDQNATYDMMGANILRYGGKSISGNEVGALDGIRSSVQQQIDGIKTNGTIGSPTIEFGPSLSDSLNGVSGQSWGPAGSILYVNAGYLAPTNKLFQKIKTFVETLTNKQSSGTGSIPITISGVTGNTSFNGNYNAYLNLNAITNASGASILMESPDFTGSEDFTNATITVGDTTKITPIELKALDGVTGNIQAQIDYIMSIINP